MPTIEEMTAWTPDEIRAEIHAMLPPGWRFEFSDETDQLRVALFGVAGENVWWSTGAEYRVLLLDAYGWLWRRQQKTVNPVWRPRDRPQLVPVHKRSPQNVGVPDPEDLDPSEDISVYSVPPKR